MDALQRRTPLLFLLKIREVGVLIAVILLAVIFSIANRDFLLLENLIITGIIGAFGKPNSRRVFAKSPKIIVCGNLKLGINSLFFYLKRQKTMRGIASYYFKFSHILKLFKSRNNIFFIIIFKKLF